MNQAEAVAAVTRVAAVYDASFREGEMSVHDYVNTTTLEKSDRIHRWFDLTYASYLVLPRSMLQSLPDDLQDRLVSTLEAIEDHLGHNARIPHTGCYSVFLRDNDGRFMRDPLGNYDRGRRIVTKHELEELAK